MDFSFSSLFETSMGLDENSSQCINGTIYNDDFVENDETIVLALISLDPLISIDEMHSSTTICIKDDPIDSKF